MASFFILFSVSQLLSDAQWGYVEKGMFKKYICFGEYQSEGVIEEQLLDEIDCWC